MILPAQCPKMLFLIATMDLLALKAPVSVSMDTTSIVLNGLYVIEFNYRFIIK